ncbi:hypothetical protein KJ633_05695 [bacterium]|nr:hypothetical protein [bacterium]MBU3955936.1 hypothetical protein [bacterium]
MRKRSWLLFILIALLWWLNFYTKRRKPDMQFLPSAGIARPSLEEIKAKEKVLNENLIKKAQKTFFDETGREAKDTKELIDRGLISGPESISP